MCICISPQPSVGVDPSSGLSSSRLQRSTLGKCCCSSIGKICWFVQNVDAGEKYFVGHILAQFVETTSWFAFARFSINLSVLIIRKEFEEHVCCLLKIQKVWTIARWLYYNILDEDHRRFPAAPPDGFSACRRVAGEGGEWPRQSLHRTDLRTTQPQKRAKSQLDNEPLTEKIAPRHFSFPCSLLLISCSWISTGNEEDTSKKM